MFTIEEFNELFPDVPVDNAAIGSDGLRIFDFKAKNNEIRNKKFQSISKGSYYPEPYKERLILKGRGKPPRLISIPSISDRFLLSGLNKYVQSFLNEQQKMPQQLVSEISLCISDYKNYVRLDFTTFYDTISQDKLHHILIEKNMDQRMVDLIERIIRQKTLPDRHFSDVGIPQGLAVSNSLAQIYLDDFSRDLNKIISGKFKIIRYVDDAIILFNNRAFKKVYTDIVKLLKDDYSVNINKEKSQYGRLKGSVIDFLGYHFEISSLGKPVVSIKKSSITKITSNLTNTIVKYKKSGKKFDEYKFKLVFQLRVRIAGLVIKKGKQVKKYGWIFFYSQINDLSVLFRLDKFLKKQLYKNFNNSQVEYIDKELAGFVRSYFEMKSKRANSSAAIHPDTFNNQEKVSFLKYVAKIDETKLDYHDDQKVDQTFKREVFKVVKNVEEDLSMQIS